MERFGIAARFALLGRFKVSEAFKDPKVRERAKVAVAEKCGWHVRQEDDGEFSLINPEGKKVSADWEPGTTLDSFSYLFPDYPSSLDAMREAKLTLTETQFRTFTDHLMFIMVAHYPGRASWSNEMLLGLARAEDECEAFLNTHGEWEKVIGGKA